MTNPTEPDATLLLERVRQGDTAAAARLMPLVYDELRAVAGRVLAGERAGHTLQPTALVHEVYLKLVDQSRVDWQGKTHFVGVAVESMRRILVDHARARGAQKRGGDRGRVALDANLLAAPESEVDVLALDSALEKLRAVNERHFRVVELRVFGGLTVEEVAVVLGISRATVSDDWAMARAWLACELSGDSAG